MDYLVVLAAIAIVWFYSEEIIGFFQLDRVNRMSNRKLDRFENEQLISDIAYYSGKEIPSDENVKKATANKKRLQDFRTL